MPRFIIAVSLAEFWDEIVTINFMKNAGLTKKSETLKNIKIIIKYKNGLEYLNIWQLKLKKKKDFTAIKVLFFKKI